MSSMRSAGVRRLQGSGGFECVLAEIKARRGSRKGLARCVVRAREGDGRALRDGQFIGLKGRGRCCVDGFRLFAPVVANDLHSCAIGID
eukprot:6622632-Lingulodinium_polyedra.AAC.1